MARTLFVCALLVALPLASRAENPPAPTETVVRLTVQPMLAPKPALKYQLLPELRELHPGNPIQGYFKCFLEQNNFFFGKEAVADREKWQTMPLADLPLAKVRNYGGKALKRADRAARQATPDWQILGELKAEGVHLLLPELGPLRGLAVPLKVRFRAEVAERRFDDALVTAKTMFALARHVGEHPTMIGELVGLAIAFVTLGPLEEMIQQPGCPNLYWALTDLPRPFIALRKGAQAERLLLGTELPELEKTAPLTEAQLGKVVEKAEKLVRLAGPIPEGRAKAWLQKRAGDEAHVRAARRRLVEAGLAEGRVKGLGALQVVLLDEKLAYEVRRDEDLRWLSLPFWQAEAALSAPARKEEGLFVPLRPRVYNVRRAQARFAQRIALLRHVEALRLYAAAHGELPARLADVEVPLPVDPVTGKPFSYKLEGKTAVLRGSPPKGQEKVAVYNVRYEVTLRK